MVLLQVMTTHLDLALQGYNKLFMKMNQPPEFREAALKDTAFTSRINRRKINL